MLMELIDTPLAAIQAGVACVLMMLISVRNVPLGYRFETRNNISIVGMLLDARRILCLLTGWLKK